MVPDCRKTLFWFLSALEKQPVLCEKNGRIYKGAVFMRIHEFVCGNKPVMVLIHGMLTPWQIWGPQIAFYKKAYNVYAVSLNAHNEEMASEFISVQAETEEIIRLLKEKKIKSERSQFYGKEECKKYEGLWTERLSV